MHKEDGAEFYLQEKYQAFSAQKPVKYFFDYFIEAHPD